MTTAAPRSIRVHSGPDDAWFRTEIEAIATGLLTESARETGGDNAACLGSHMHALVTAAVWRLARHRASFTLSEIYHAVEHGNIPLSEGMTAADRAPLLRRLNRVVERSSPARADRGGQP
jgi:hypothetical protein